MTPPKKGGGNGGDGGGDDYEVGYGKPPRHTRFQPGHSGNPRGRPKGTKNLKTDLLEELAERIDVREGGKSRRVSKQRAIVKALVARTLNGDVRAATLLTSMILRLLGTGEGAPNVDEPLLEDEREILRTFAARVQQGGVDGAVSKPHDAGQDES